MNEWRETPRARISLSDLPPRARPLGDAALERVFGGCVPQGSACMTASQCCQVYVQPGDYVLCYFYRSERINTGYCSRSSVVHGS